MYNQCNTRTTVNTKHKDSRSHKLHVNHRVGYTQRVTHSHHKLTSIHPTPPWRYERNRSIDMNIMQWLISRKDGWVSANFANTPSQTNTPVLHCHLSPIISEPTWWQTHLASIRLGHLNGCEKLPILRIWLKALFLALFNAKTRFTTFHSRRVGRFNSYHSKEFLSGAKCSISANLYTGLSQNYFWCTAIRESMKIK